MIRNIVFMVSDMQFLLFTNAMHQRISVMYLCWPDGLQGGFNRVASQIYSRNLLLCEKKVVSVFCAVSTENNVW